MMGSTSAPDYLGNIDIEELKKYHDFSTVTESNSIVAKYLKLKAMLSKKQQLEESKKNTRYQIMSKLLQNRRLDVEDDSDSKIKALQLLVKSNIDDSLRTQHNQLSGAKNDLGLKHMAYVIPSAENLNMFSSQVEKPIQSDVNSGFQNLPFLHQDTNQFPSQSVMINPGVSTLPSYTPSPLLNDVHSTLPFLDYNQNIPTSSHKPMILTNFNDFVMKTPQRISQSMYPQQPYHSSLDITANQNLYGTSFVAPIFPISSNQVFLQNPSQQLFLQKVNNPYNIQMIEAQEEEAKLKEQLEKLRRVEQSVKSSKPAYSSVASKGPLKRHDTVMRSLSGFPMNFEEMLTTGLKLAKQSEGKNLQNQNLGEIIQPRVAQQKTWSHVPIPQNSAPIVFQQKQNGFKITDDFTPSQKIPPELMQLGSVETEKKYEEKDFVSNDIKIDNFHIIGPNCYGRSKSGFKLVGKASSCIGTTNQMKDSNSSKDKGENTSSIWDSITSLPFVNKFAKSFGIK